MIVQVIEMRAGTSHLEILADMFANLVTRQANQGAELGPGSWAGEVQNPSGCATLLTFPSQ